MKNTNPVIEIIVNEKKDPGFEYSNSIGSFLRARGFNPKISRPTELSVPSLFCVVLGGDGTMLVVSHYAAVLDLPMIGINLGTLGFLTDVDKAHGFQALEIVLQGKHTSEKRMMLEAEFGCGQAIPLQERLALNEVHIGECGSLIEYSVYVNEQLMTTTRCDGVIISTPTGSTAYNLAAGGPLLHPRGQMIAITPVCPHSLSARPLVVSASDTIRIVSKKTSRVHVDGYSRGIVSPGESVLIKTSQNHATIIKTAHVNFYTTLRKKKLM